MNPENQTTPSQPPVPETQPVLPTPKTNWPVSILFLIIGILIGAGGLWGYQSYLASKPTATPTPTTSQAPNGDLANWKTYTDTNHFVEFKYPQNYRGGEIDVTSNSKWLDIGKVPDTSLLEVGSEKTNISLKDWWSKQGVNSAKIKFATYTESTFNGIKSIEITFGKGNEFGNEKVILLNTNGRNYSILVSHSMDCDDQSVCWEKYLENQILSTFKFSNSNSQKASPTIAFLPPLSDADRKNDRDAITTKVINPFIDFQYDLDPNQVIVSITVENNVEASSNNQFPFKFTALFKSIGSNQMLLSQTNGVLNWYEPTCQGCKLTSEFAQKYPEIAKQFNQVYGIQ